MSTDPTPARPAGRPRPTPEGQDKIDGAIDGFIRQRTARSRMIAALDEGRTCANGLGHISHRNCEKIVDLILKAVRREQR